MATLPPEFCEWLRARGDLLPESPRPAPSGGCLTLSDVHVGDTRWDNAEPLTAEAFRQAMRKMLAQAFQPADWWGIPLHPKVYAALRGENLGVMPTPDEYRQSCEEESPMETLYEVFVIDQNRNILLNSLVIAKTAEDARAKAGVDQILRDNSLLPSDVSIGIGGKMNVKVASGEES